MHTYWSSLAVEASPGLTMAFAAFLAALPPYALLRQSGRGRARSAVGYLCGFAAGLAGTVLASIAILAFADRAAVLQAGAFGAFFGPFVGIARAKWEGRRKPPKRPAMARSFSR
ncbi:MAG: hypothetical protein F9K29_09090 [Hyphomicrobiaceae bacterium]|nr:MAG: hypothetical protein F9K29_09090 [Hyphomicrobiaceae bacterium]